jgi:amino acid adenylation domain-containing protein
MLLHHGVQASAASSPRALAVCCREQCMSYAELWSAACALAGALAARGVRPGDRVGICASKSVASVVAIYAVSALGAAYVPLDVGSPAARLARIVADCSPVALLCDEAGAALLAASFAPVYRLDELIGRAAPAHAPPTVGRLDSDLACILYTSGTTGVPKGVALTHGNVLTFARWARDEVELHGHDVVASHAPFHFDLSTFDLFSTALAGACVALLPSALGFFPRSVLDFIHANAISVWYSVPSALVQLLPFEGAFRDQARSLRRVMLAGERLRPVDLRRLREALPAATFFNWYGPTESNVITSKRFAPGVALDGAGPRTSIGRACPYAQISLEDEAGATVPPGQEGELVVRGPSVMRGYFAAAEDSASRRRLAAYRTGDVACELPDGEFDLLGRRDGMVKVHGFRVELGEIEAALATLAGVLDACVVCCHDAQQRAQLVAAVVLAADGVTDALHTGLAQLVPAYMIPHRIEAVASFPRTSSGKVDRRALLQRFEPGISA